MVVIIWVAFIYTVLAACTVCAIIGGMKAGLLGALLRLGATLLSAVIAFAAVKFMASLFFTLEVDVLCWFLPADLSEILRTGEDIGVLVGAVSGGVLLPILFALLSGILQIAASIVLHHTARACPQANRGWGAAVGAVRGVLLALILLLPLLSVQGLLDAVMTDHPALEAELSETLGEESVKALHRTSEVNLPYLLLGDNLVKLTVKEMSTAHFDGGDTDAYEALGDLSDVVETVVPLTEEELDFSALTDRQCAQLNKVLDAVDDSPLLAGVLADIISPWAAAWAEGKSFMGVEFAEEENGELLSPVYRRAFLTLADSDRDNVVSNLKIMLNTMVLWTEFKENAANSKEQLDLYLAILAPFEGNPFMDAVSDEIKIVGMRATVQSEIPALEDEREYEAMIGGISEIVGDGTADVGTVSDQLCELMLSYDYEISAEDAEAAAELLIEKRQEVGAELTEADIADIYTELMDRQS